VPDHGDTSSFPNAEEKAKKSLALSRVPTLSQESGKPFWCLQVPIVFHSAYAHYPREVLAGSKSERVFMVRPNISSSLLLQPFVEDFEKARRKWTTDAPSHVVLEYINKVTRQSRPTLTVKLMNEFLDSVGRSKETTKADVSSLRCVNENTSCVREMPRDSG